MAEHEITGNAVSVNTQVIKQIRFLTESTFVLRFSRGNLQFRAGQRIIVGLEGDLDQREYSIYSGENDDYLEILVKEVKEGNVSAKLSHSEPGQLLQVNGPFGSFRPEAYERYSKKLIFIATGTGISPFHSLIRTYPGMDYTLLHGVRFSSEAYDRNEYDQGRYILCTSKEKYNGRKGRVTQYLNRFKVSSHMLFFLCGNGNMIYEVDHILLDKGISSERILTEVYF